MMFWTSAILSILGAVMLAFGAWGRFTEAGARKYDEMAGIIPFFSYYAGIGLLVIAAVLWVIIYTKR